MWVFENDTLEKVAHGDKQALHDLQSEVPHSAQWIFFAGKRIFEEIHPDVREVEVRWNRKGKQTPPKNEVTRMKWDAWRTGANEVAELTKANKETRAIAREMVRTMESIENEADGDGP